ncbi:hypothetical protein CAOG_06609 [Capsaspora owczarzaki ATCC 30864]|uniref:hypothetical protein n=1 Tax=Capsaspora owczarzaki (strain ATCC 30864) TaxID=595528 RepID=UPI0001FE4129|nr:hypothetical protein CAOG_06609 [Capsaspora owczarzaki ATCC 30864]|eukprot:XP_004344230.1 hypothetical protein CAOG_06609 [Capsaspora owczarzaki ATCC 30864]
MLSSVYLGQNNFTAFGNTNAPPSTFGNVSDPTEPIRATAASASAASASIASASSASLASESTAASSTAQANSTVTASSISTVTPSSKTLTTTASYSPSVSSSPTGSSGNETVPTGPFTCNGNSQHFCGYACPFQNATLCNFMSQRCNFPSGTALSSECTQAITTFCQNNATAAGCCNSTTPLRCNTDRSLCVSNMTTCPLATTMTSGCYDTAFVCPVGTQCAGQLDCGNGVCVPSGSKCPTGSLCAGGYRCGTLGDTCTRTLGQCAPIDRGSSSAVNITNFPNAAIEFPGLNLNTICGQIVADYVLRMRTSCVFSSISVCQTCKPFLDNVVVQAYSTLDACQTEDPDSYTWWANAASTTQSQFAALGCGAATASDNFEVSPGPGFVSVRWSRLKDGNLAPFSYSAEVAPSSNPTARVTSSVRPFILSDASNQTLSAVIRGTFVAGQAYVLRFRTTRGSSVTVSNPYFVTMPVGSNSTFLNFAENWLDYPNAVVYLEAADRLELSSIIGGANVCGGTGSGFCIHGVTTSWSVTGFNASLSTLASLQLDASQLPVATVLTATVTATFYTSTSNVSSSLNKSIDFLVRAPRSDASCIIDGSDSGIFMQDVFSLQCPPSVTDMGRLFFSRPQSSSGTSDGTSFFPKASAQAGLFYIDSLPPGTMLVTIRSSSPFGGQFSQTLVFTVTPPGNLNTDSAAREVVLNQAQSVFNSDQSRSGIALASTLVNAIADAGTGADTSSRREIRSQLITGAVAIVDATQAETADAVTPQDLTDTLGLFFELTRFPNELTTEGLGTALGALRIVAGLLRTVGIEEAAKVNLAATLGSLLRAIPLLQTGNNSPASREFSALAFDVLQRLGSAARANRAPGDVDVIETHDIVIRNENRDSNNLGASPISRTAGANFTVPSYAAGSAPVVGVEYVHHLNNPFAYDNATDEQASDTFSLRLTDADGNEISVGNLDPNNPILIGIPVLRPLVNPNNTLVCMFRNETTGKFSHKGCSVVSNGTDSLLCNCTHLTAFAIFEINPIDFDDVTRHLSERIAERPWLVVFLAAIVFVYLFILLPFAIRNDRRVKRDLLDASSKLGSVLDKEFAQDDAVAEILNISSSGKDDKTPIMPFKERLVLNMKNRHIYLSIFVKRHLDRNFSHVARATVGTTTLLMCMGLNTLIYNQMSFETESLAISIVNGIISTFIIFPLSTLIIELFRHSFRYPTQVRTTMANLESAMELSSISSVGNFGYDEKPVSKPRKRSLADRWSAWRIPHAWQYVAYFLCFVFSATGIFLTVFWAFSETFDDDDIYRMWFISACVSIIQSVLISSTVKVFIMTAILTWVDHCRHRKNRKNSQAK